MFSQKCFVSTYEHYTYMERIALTSNARVLQKPQNSDSRERAKEKTVILSTKERKAREETLV